MWPPVKMSLTPLIKGRKIWQKHLYAPEQDYPEPSIWRCGSHVTLDTSEFPHLKDGNEQSSPSPFHRSVIANIQGKEAEDGKFIHQGQSSPCGPTTLGLCQSALLTFRANQPEMGKVISNNKNPRKLTRTWQRKEGQV